MAESRWRHSNSCCAWIHRIAISAESRTTIVRQYCLIIIHLPFLFFCDCIPSVTYSSEIQMFHLPSVSGSLPDCPPPQLRWICSSSPFETDIAQEVLGTFSVVCNERLRTRRILAFRFSEAPNAQNVLNSIRLSITFEH